MQAQWNCMFKLLVLLLLHYDLLTDGNDGEDDDTIPGRCTAACRFPRA